MKRMLLLALIALLSVPIAIRCSTSEEDRIRELVEDALEAFDEGSVSGVIEPLARDFRLKGRNMGRDEIRQVMLFLSREARDESGFRLRAWRDPETDLLDLEGDSATYTMEITLRRRESGEFEDVWEFQLRLELSNRDGWEIDEAVIETFSGRPRY